MDLRGEDQTRRQNVETVKTEFKIMRGPVLQWVGLIIGAKTLDCEEYRGWFFVPSYCMHALTTVSLLLPRKE